MHLYSNRDNFVFRVVNRSQREWEIKLWKKGPKIKKSRDQQWKARVRPSDNKIANLTAQGIQESRETWVEELISTSLMWSPGEKKKIMRFFCRTCSNIKGEYTLTSVLVALLTGCISFIIKFSGFLTIKKRWKDRSCLSEECNMDC